MILHATGGICAVHLQPIHRVTGSAVQVFSSAVQIFRRAITLPSTERLSDFFHRIKSRVRRCYSSLHKSIHLHAFASDINTIKNAEAQLQGFFEKSRRLIALEFKEIFPQDEAEINQLTKIDPWNFPKALTIRHLNQGCKCFVAKKEGQIVACFCAWTTADYYDDFLKCRYILNPEEAYCWRAFCVPDFRSIGVLPRVMAYATETLASKYKKTKQISWVRTTNKPMQKTLQSMGWRVVGHGGFVELMGLRFHYLWGREAFKETKNRILLRFS